MSARQAPMKPFESLQASSLREAGEVNINSVIHENMTGL